MKTRFVPMLFLVACSPAQESSGMPAMARSETSPHGLEVGECASDFTLPDRTGTAFTLSSQRGKVALVDHSAVW